MQTVHVVDVNESPVLSPVTLYIPDAPPEGWVVGLVPCYDDDVFMLPPRSQGLKFSIIDGDPDGVFVIGGNGESLLEWGLHVAAC